MDDIQNTAPADEKVVYEIVDSEHPENNQIIDPSEALAPTPEQAERHREDMFQRLLMRPGSCWRRRSTSVGRRKISGP